MTNIKHIILAVVSMVSLTSCGDFLEEVSQDEIKPSTVEDMRQLMNKDAYPYQYYYDYYLDFLTDDMSCNGCDKSNATYVTYLQNAAAIFQFNPEMFDGKETFPDDADSWKNLYAKIKGCNVVYDYMEKVSGTEKEKNALKGQVRFLRAYYYLKLVLIYGQPYNGKNVNPDTALGVPLILTMNVTDNFPKRNTLRECYNQIEKDFLEAEALIRENYEADNEFRISTTAVDAMLSRFYLYKGDYAKVIEYADKAIKEGPALTQLSSFKKSFFDNGIYDSNVSTEAIWKYGSESTGTYYSNEMFYGKPPYTVSDDLINLYEKDDLRDSCYFAMGKNYTTGEVYRKFSQKTGNHHSGYGPQGIRIAEVYLNRAEAKIRLAQNGGNQNYLSEALSDLNKLRKSRFNEGTYHDKNITDGQELLTFCLQERRREMALEEGLRWFDIKRLGLSVEHTFIDTEGTSKTCKLEANSNLYALPIPYKAIERNHNLKQNPR